MKLFTKNKTKAEQSRLDALKATKVIIQHQIDMISKNGHFSHTKTIRKEFMDGRDLAKDIVPVLQSEFEKDGYTVTIENDNFIINW
jgi:hypothetical protein